MTNQLFQQFFFFSFNAEWTWINTAYFDRSEGIDKSCDFLAIAYKPSPEFEVPLFLLKLKEALFVRASARVKISRLYQLYILGIFSGRKTLHNPHITASLFLNFKK